MQYQHFDVILNVKQNTYITPASNAFHFPKRRDFRMPLIIVHVYMTAKFAGPGPISLHQVCVVKRGNLWNCGKKTNFRSMFRVSVHNYAPYF